MAQNLETGLIINKLTGDTVGLNVQNSDALINDVTVGRGFNSGFGNTVVGQFALTGKTNTQYNTAIGYKALKDNQASNNVAIGGNTLSSNVNGSANIAIGIDALKSNISSSGNIAMGEDSLGSLTFGGGNNISFGSSALKLLTGGTKNIVISHGGLQNIKNTNENIIIGNDSSSFIEIGSWNVVLGNLTLVNTTASTENTIIGHNSMIDNIDGNYNTSLGASSLVNNIRGSYNVGIGYNSGPSLSGLSNTTTIGANCTVTKNNSVILGSPNDSTIMIGIGTSSPNDSAKLQVDSTTKGFLPPRMTGTQAAAITSPSEGLMLYVTNTTGGFTSKGWYGYDGSVWDKLDNEDIVNQGTGLTIHFSGKTIFNLPTLPADGNISHDLTNAKFGMIQKIYHSGSTVPTVPTEWQLVGEGTYFTYDLNIIYAEYVTNNWIEYWIIQKQI